jgi:hypothetical protein
MSSGRSSRSFGSLDMIRNSCSASRRFSARSVAGAPGEVTRNLIRAWRVVATRWKAGQSCQPSPSPSGSSSITHEPASRWRRCTTPIRAIRLRIVSSRRDGTDWCGVAASSSRSEIPGKPVLPSSPSSPNKSVRDAIGSRHRSPGQPERASADSQVRPGPRLPTLRPYSVKIGEAGPEALSPSSLPIRALHLTGVVQVSATPRATGRTGTLEP